MSTFFCSYCGKDKPIDEQTSEHVLPQKLGGAVNPTNPFKLNTVCERCNRTCGRFVDAPFTLNSLINAHYVLMANEFVDVEKGEAMPLNYMGFLNYEEAVLEGYDCEVWLGPTGDHVFHFHRPNPSIPGTLGMVSMKFLKDIDPGFVVAFLTSNNPAWHPTLIRSIAGNFSEETAVYFANVGFTEEPKGSNIRLLNDDKRALAAKLKALLGSQPTLKIRQTMDIDFADRFEAKVALGFGSLFLVPEFQKSPYAKFLRDYLWEKDVAARKNMPLHGSGILNGVNPKFMTALANKYCISALLVPTDSGVGLAMNLFGQFEFVVLISDDITHWPAHFDPAGVGISLISPLRTSLGPLPLMEYVVESLANHPQSKMKAILDSAATKKKARPPFLLDV